MAEFEDRCERAVGRSSPIGANSSPEDIAAAFWGAGEIPWIEDAYRINGKTHVVEEPKEPEKGSQDPDFKLIDDAYEISAPGKAWFVLSIAPLVGTPERVRRFAKHKKFLAWWPRRVSLRVRGRGSRRRKYAAVSSLFPRYVLVHLPARGTLLDPIVSRAEWVDRLRGMDRRDDAEAIEEALRWCKDQPEREREAVIGQPYSAPFGALTTHEGRFNGVGDWLANAAGPVPVPDWMVERVIAREREGEFDQTVKRGKRTVSKMPNWVFLGAIVRIVSGPFAMFNGIVEEIDEVKEQLKVAVSIFGRATPVTLGLAQVEELC